MKDLQTDASTRAPFYSLGWEVSSKERPSRTCKDHPQEKTRRPSRPLKREEEKKNKRGGEVQTRRQAPLSIMPYQTNHRLTFVKRDLKSKGVRAVGDD